MQHISKNQEKYSLINEIMGGEKGDKSGEFRVRGRYLIVCVAIFGDVSANGVVGVDSVGVGECCWPWGWWLGCFSKDTL